MTWLSNFFKSLAAYIGAFFSGILAEKYHDSKEENKDQKKRDKIDAEPNADKRTILERMRNGKL